MTGNSIVAYVHDFGSRFWQRLLPQPVASAHDLHDLWCHPSSLPAFVAAAPAARRLLNLLRPLHWSNLPERDLMRNWGQQTVPYAAFVAAYLIKLNEGQHSMGDLRDYLIENPALLWLCGFPATVTAQSRSTNYGFDADASLPTARHFTRLLRNLPNAVLQVLLTDSVHLILAELHARNVAAPDTLGVDTKHIIAWVKENNPKAYVHDRYDKTRQPLGDPDCRLGWKRRHNKTDSQPGELHFTLPTHIQILYLLPVSPLANTTGTMVPVSPIFTIASRVRTFFVPTREEALDQLGSTKNKNSGRPLSGRPLCSTSFSS